MRPFVLGAYLVSIFFYSSTAHSQDINVSATVNPQQIHLNERTTLQVTISGKTQLKHIQPPVLELLPEFIATYAGLSDQYRWLENGISPSITWSYELIPQKTGKFTLKKIRVPYDGKTYVADTLSVTVLPPLQKQVEQGSSPNSFTDALSGSAHKIEAFVDNTRPYVNEQITYTFRHLYTTQLPSGDSPKLPSLSGFRTWEVPSKQGLTEVINGTKYRVSETRVALFPIAAGRTTIESAQLRLPDSFDFGRSDVPKNLITRQIGIDVRPLPQVGKPANFTGAVGEYQIAAEVKQAEIRVGAGFTLWLQVLGTGNIETLKSPSIPAIPNVTIYDPTVTTEVDEVDSKVQRKHIYAYVVVPAQAGSLTIPEIAYPYFHPQKNRYQVAQTDTITRTVLPELTAGIQSLPNNKEGEPKGAGGVAGPFYKRTSFWGGQLLLVVCILVCVLAVWSYQRKRAKLSPDRRPPQNAGQSALQAIEAAEQTMGHGSAIFFTTLANSLYQYIGDILNISPTGLNPEGVHHQCLKANIPESATKQLVEVLMQCDHARFAPVSRSPDALKNTSQRAKAVIHNIEKNRTP